MKIAISSLLLLLCAAFAGCDTSAAPTTRGCALAAMTGATVRWVMSVSLIA